MSVSTSYTNKGKVKDPRYMENKKDSRISLGEGVKNWPNLPMDSSKKLPGLGVKNRENLPTS